MPGQPSALRRLAGRRLSRATVRRLVARSVAPFGRLSGSTRAAPAHDAPGLVSRGRHTPIIAYADRRNILTRSSVILPHPEGTSAPSGTTADEHRARPV